MEDIRRLLRQHQNLVLFMVSGFIIPLITNLLSSWLETTYGKTPAQLLQLLAILAALAVSLGVLTLLLWRTSRSGVLVPEELRPAPHPGLIVLVGPGRAEPPIGNRPNVAEEAIQYHHSKGNLKHVWLVTSDAGVPVAEDLREKYRELVKVILIHDILDINETYNAVRQIYTQEAVALDLNPADIIADYTGGTKPMSVGMALAAASGPYPMQFTSGKPGTLAAPIQTKLVEQNQTTQEG